MATILKELQRRSVFRVAVAYFALAWLALQIVETVKGLISLPDWVGPVALITLAVGFPIAMVLAWFYELTPEGIRSADDAEIQQPVARFGGRKIDFVIIGALSLVIVLLLVKDTIVQPTPGGEDGIPMVKDYKRLTRSQIVFPPFASPYPLVADASRLYFNNFDSAVMHVRQLTQAGGEAVPFDTPWDNPSVVARPTAMTPDKAGVVMTVLDVAQGASPPELWVLPVLGGTPRKLGEGYNAAYSRDGRFIGYGGMLDFENRESQLIIANADMTEPREFFETGEELTWIDFSPAGERIRFSTWGQHPRIWETTIDGDPVRAMLPDWDHIEHCCGSWTPDGQYYVFQAKHGDRTQLWAVRDVGGKASEPEQITAGALNFRRPTIAADGKRIFAIGWQLRGEIVRYSAEVGQFVPVPGLDGISGEYLTYSADGSRIAYTGYPDEHLWTVNSDGSNRTQLTFDPMEPFTGNISPDGRYVAFSGWVGDDESRQIYIVPSTGGTPEPITTEDNFETSQTWSPDSATIAFTRNGSNAIVLYDIGDQSVSTIEGTEGLRFPDWSPDGRFIAAWTEDRAVVLFDMQTGASKEILGFDAEIQSFYWARDSRHIYLVDSLDLKPDGGVHRISIYDGSTEMIASVAAVRSAIGTWGTWVGVDPEGAPLMLRDLSIHHIYELDWLKSSGSE